MNEQNKTSLANSQGQSGPVTAREGLTSKEVQATNETAISAVVTKSRAEIETAYVMARKFPRSEADARIKVLKTCRIPSFAEKAKYKKPQGKSKDEKGQWVQNYIIGPSVRLAEELARQWGNIDMEMTILYEDNRRRLCQIRVIDLESGATARAQFVIEKTVERKNAVGREVVDERINSTGEKISIVVATEDEVLSKQNAMASKYRRNLVLQMIPADVLTDALDAVDETMKGGIKADPEKHRKTIADNFSKIGVLPSQIEKYLGGPLSQITADEMAELKQIYTSIVDGETTWKEIVSQKEETVIDVTPKESVSKQDIDEVTEWEKEDKLKVGDPETHTHPGEQQKAGGVKK